MKQSRTFRPLKRSTSEVTNSTTHPVRRSSIHASVLFGLLVLSFTHIWGQPVTAVASAATRPLEEVVGEAREAFAERSFAHAEPLFAEWRQRAALDSNEFLEARIYELACRILLQRAGQVSAEGDPDALSRRVNELETHAKMLRSRAGTGGGRWLKIYEMAAFELSVDRESWRPLGTLLNFWARSTDLDHARTEYLRLIWEASNNGRNSSRFQTAERREWVIDATRIAQSAEDIARFNLLLADTYPIWETSNAEFPLRRGNALERAVAAGRDTAAYAEALWQLGQWSERFGTPAYDDSGARIYQANYVRAAAAYRRILATEDPAWERWRERAGRALEQLEGPELDVLVNYAFRSETEVQFAVRWRNTDQPEIQVYPMNALVHVPSVQLHGSAPPPLEHDVPSAYRAVLERTPERPHFPVIAPVRLGESLPPGAYAIVARSGELVDWAPLFVTDLVVVTHRTQDEMVAFVADATTGEPRPGVPAHLVLRSASGGTGAVTTEAQGISDADGLISFVWPEAPDGRGWNWHLTVADGEGEGTTALSGYQWNSRRATTEKAVYLMSDRSLYRPGEIVNIAGWLRERSEGRWQIPDVAEAFSYKLRAVNGEFETAGSLVLSPQGSFAVPVELPEDAPLGTYFMRIEHPDARYWGGSNGALFRVEEFRAPEVRASITLDHAENEPILPGDLIEGTVEVEYYSGGALEDAMVELAVSRRPFFPRWQPFIEDPWLYRHGSMPFAPSHGEEVSRQVVETDARGTVRFEIPTDREVDQDWTYQIEARVRDLSRREVLANESIHVTRQSYFAHLELANRLIAPNDHAQLTITLLDANDRPVADDGVVRVERDRWREVFVHRKRGSELSGEQFRELPERSMLGSAQGDYRLREAGFVTEEVAVAEVLADENGKAFFRFSPPEPGYYKFEWVSRGQRGQPVTANVPLWVASELTEDIGYRPGGVQLIADPGPFEVGQPIPVMVAAPARERTVFLTISGADGETAHRVLRLDGASRLFTFTPGRGHQPNFYIDASMVSDEAHLTDTLELIVPPREQYLEVDVKLDSHGYEPGDTANVWVEVRNAAGEPVETELIIGASDEALYSIQPSMRQPVREAFYANRNPHRISIGSSLTGQAFFAPLADMGLGERETQDYELELSPFQVAAGVDAREGGFRSAFAEMASEAPPAVAEDKAQTLEGLTQPSASGEAIEVTVRRDFRSTLFWSGIRRTGADGRAEFEMTFPDNLTSWHLEAVAVTDQTDVGDATTTTTTRLPLIGRLQLPRFLTERDVVTVSGVFQNNTASTLSIRPTLTSQGPVEWTGTGGRTDYLAVHPGGVRRTDWEVQAVSPGTAVFQLMTRGELVSDAVERLLVVVPHGTQKTEGRLGRSSGEPVSLALALPEGANRETLDVFLRASPSLAPQLFGALPYLIEFPYGCSEQTISRFLPALMVRRSAERLGIPLTDLDAEVYAGLSSEAVRGREDLRAVLDDVMTEGIERLAEMQKADGSWPWMPEGPSDPYMTAYAVWSLSFAEEIDLDLGEIRLNDARAWLERMLVERDLARSDQAWMLLALSSRYRIEGFGRPSRMEARVFLDLMNDRQSLSPMSLGMLALTARYFGFDEEARTLLRNLADSVHIGDAAVRGITDARGNPLEIPTAYWGQVNGYFDWNAGAVESTAFVLHALLATDPEHPWVEPSVNWLSRNRTGAHWPNTRATAITLLVLTDYLAQGGGDMRESAFRVQVNGQPVEHEGESLFVSSGWAPVQLSLPPEAFAEGDASVTIERADRADPFYFELYADYFDTSEDIWAGASDLVLNREFWHLKPVPTLLEGIQEVMTPLEHGASVQTGDRVEVVLRIEAPREMRYVLVEDRRPAGLEAVQLLSGPTAVARELPLVPVSPDTPRTDPGLRRVQGYQELRDRHVAFLFDRLPKGTWEIRYRLRAESPGRFHGMPAEAKPMYLPHVGANSAEWRIEVTDDRE